jgi:hypothetical protein
METSGIELVQAATRRRGVQTFARIYWRQDQENLKTGGKTSAILAQAAK